MEAEKRVAVGGVGESCSSPRQRFFIELRPGETTIVSWKRLVKDANPSAPVSLRPSSTSNHKTHQPTAAKDECSEDGMLMMDLNGFLLEAEKSVQVNEPDLSANHQSKKRRRKTMGASGDRVNDHMHKKLLGHAGLKIAATNPLIGVHCSSNSHNLFSRGDCDSKLNDGSSSPITSSTRIPADSITKSEHSSCTEITRASDFPLSSKYTVKQVTGKTHQLDADYSLSSGTTYEKSQEINFSNQFELLRKRTVCDEMGIPTEVAHWEKKSNCEELPDLNIPVPPLPPERIPSTFLKDGLVRNSSCRDGSGMRPKWTALERAIKDLEKVVAESCFLGKLPAIEFQNPDTSCIAIKKRLPNEVKQKLAKVARLGESSQGKISEKLINRLMSILGNSMQLRTLKRNLRAMVLMGLSAKREKADKFLQIKEEIIEMIRLQGSKLRDKPTSELRGVLCTEEKMVFGDKYNIDAMMGDKIFDLYEIYIQGMDEDKGPQIRKLYAELAELWPNGMMDSSGIKSAISRAKKRRRILRGYEVSENHKERKFTPKMEVVQGEAGPSTHLYTKREKSHPTSGENILALPCKLHYLTEKPDLQPGDPVDMSGPLLDSNLPKQGNHNKSMLPVLKEQKPQQRRECEGRAKKPSSKPENEAHSYTKQVIMQSDALRFQATGLPSSGQPSGQAL